MLAKGFSKPTERIERLRKVIINSTPQVESERACLITEAYKETEDLPMVMRRAKAVEKILTEMPIIIRDDELIVGSMTINPRSASIYPEFSFEWVEKEFDTMPTRMADPFKISEKVKKELHDIFLYWKGKTTSELASSYMCQDTKDCIANGVFTVGNYFYGGVGHVCVDYGKIIKRGFRGVLEDVITAMNGLDINEPDSMKKRQFYNALIVSYNAAIIFAHRYANKARELANIETNSRRKQELLQIAANCERVPEYGARNFYEACQAFWFVQIIVQIESNGHSISPGRFDQYMYPYLKDDNIDREFAQELLDCLWVKFNDVSKIRDEVSAQAFAGYGAFQNLCVGGQNENGKDVTNDVSYMCMEAVAHVRLPQPSFSVRVHQNSPLEFLSRACEVSRLGYGFPAFYNDEVIILALVARGVALKDARDYNLIGCVEPQAGHRTEGWHDSAFCNIAKILEITLNGGKCNGKQLGPKTPDIEELDSLEKIFAAYKIQMEYFVKHVMLADNAVDYAHMERAPLPFMSALVDDCIKVGKASQEGGARYNFTGPQAFGVADSGDSLYAIKKNVFDEKKITLKELKEALAANFGVSCDMKMQATKPIGSMSEEDVYEAVKKILASTGSIDVATLENKLKTQNTITTPKCCDTRYTTIRNILKRTETYGNDIDEVDEIAVRCGKIYCDEVDKYKNPRGGQYQAGIYPVSANVLFGKDVLALPDGRLAHEPLSDGVSPRQGVDVSGPTAASNSVAKLDHAQASNGTLYNQKFTPSAVAGDNGLKNFVSIVRSYFDHKGSHVQFNVIDKQTLLNAQENPKENQDLIVRVAGYSAHFVTLAKEVQDDIISRTEHNM